MGVASTCLQYDVLEPIGRIAAVPDKNGRITAQTSSPNNEGGHRRLNVAVTRARRELLVFPTLRPEPPASTSVIAGKADQVRVNGGYRVCSNRTLRAPRQELWYPPSNAMRRFNGTLKWHLLLVLSVLVSCDCTRI